MLTRETKILGWAKRHRYAALVAAFALLAPTLSVLFVLGHRWRVDEHIALTETFSATNIIGTSTVTTPTYAVTGTGTPTITVCNADPPTAVAPSGSLCIDPIPTPSTLYQSQGAGSWTLVGGGGVTTPPGVFGNGTDGACVLDGAATCLGMVPAANVYTQTRDLFFTNLTVNVGITLRSGGYRDLVNGTLTLNGTIQNNGGNASGATGGVASLGGFVSGGGVGGNGAVNAGTATNGGDAPRAPIGFATGRSAVANNANGPSGGVGQGGSGGDASGGGGGQSGNTATTVSLQGINDILYASTGHAFGETSSISAGTGGGGGRGDGATGTGGGGGAGGGWVVVPARTVAGNGAIQARGGNGANGVSADGGGGGGGGGGVGVFITNSTSFSITIDANGGAKGIHAGIGHDGGNGGAGFAITFHG